MSYVLDTDCLRCEKFDTCKDRNKLEEAIKLIHSETSEEGHKGSGSIILSCFNKTGDISYNKSFSLALMYLKAGLRLARKGWNGKGMHVIKSNIFTTSNMKIENEVLLLFNVQQQYNTWMPSITDLLANDWGIVPEE